MGIKAKALPNPNETLSAIGTLVRNARKHKQLSQSELALKTRLSQKTISALENGSQGMELRTILRVLGELGLKIDIGMIGSSETIYSSEDGNMKAIKYKLGPDKEDILSSLHRVKEQLKAAGVTSLAVFGSTARGNAGPDSDVDVMVELSVPPSVMNIAKVQDILEEVIPHKVDFVLRDSLKADIRSRAEKEAVYVI